jgi:hypothetical protein
MMVTMVVEMATMTEMICMIEYRELFDQAKQGVLAKNQIQPVAGS